MATTASVREKVSLTSGDILEEQRRKLRQLFPEVFTEDKIDFDKLRATLGEALDTSPGRFSFTWAGKNDAIQLLQTPSRSTLIPCPEESINFESTGNVFIEGDNLEVLKLLFKPYFGRVKLIYIDPPYNTGHDFVYRDDGGSRRFIMIQLPEQAENSDYRTIADVGKERMRRAIAKLKNESNGTLVLEQRDKPEDLGFKVFKLTKPNIQPWTPEPDRDPDAYAEKLAMFNDPLVAGWSAENVLWEVALREGYSLNTRFEKKVLDNGNTLYEVIDPDTGQQFAVCLDDQIRADLSKCYELSAEGVLVCRDSALDDTAAANLALQCRFKTV